MSHRPSDPEPFRPIVTRYQNAQGKRCGSRDPGAVKVRTRSRVYVVDLYDRGRRERVSLKTSDKAMAYVDLRDKLRERREEDAGLRPKESQAARPLCEHLAEWLAGRLIAQVLARSLAGAARSKVGTGKDETPGWTPRQPRERFCKPAMYLA